MKVSNFDGIFWGRIGDKAAGFIFTMKFWFIDIEHRDVEHAIVSLAEGEFVNEGGAELRVESREEKQILNKLFELLKENAENDINDESNKQTFGGAKRKRKRKYR